MTPKSTIDASELVKTLVRLSERAANIARSLRAKPQLLELLIEQKEYVPKLRRDKPDFKTLADVLIQETIRFYLAKDVGSSKDVPSKRPFTRDLFPLPKDG